MYISTALRNYSWQLWYWMSGPQSVFNSWRYCKIWVFVLHYSGTPT